MENNLSKSERTRSFIIEATAGIFNKKGYAGTSMSDITQATGLSKGSIYGNFENKEEVALAVFDYNYGLINRNIQQRISIANTYHDKILAYGKVHKKYLKGSTPDGGCPVLNTAVEADDTNNLLKDKAAKAILKWKKNIQNLIMDGVEAGEFKEGLDHAQLAVSIIALIEGGIMISKVTNNQSSLDQIESTLELILNQMKV